MAKETKVGLLAGLAFIICFAVILTNRGREDLFTPLPVEAQQTADAQSQPRRPINEDLVQPTTRTQRQRPDSLRQARGPRQPMEQTPVDPRSQQDPPAMTTLSAGTTSSVDNQEPDREAMERLAAWQRQVEQRLNDLSNEIDDEARPELVTNPPTQLTAREPADNQPPADRPDPVRLPDSAPAPGLKPSARAYEVVGGDTLTKIAARVYGNNDRTVINAIYDANRSIMSSPDDLRAGVTLELPVVQGLSAGASAQPENRPERVASRGADRAAPERKPTSADSPKFRWYQVRKNDRYVVIARRELGDETRWREIYEMNKDTFPNAAHIRPGVRIKLPLTGTKNRGEAQ